MDDFNTSPVFSFADSSWRLELCPIEETGYPEGWLDLYLRRMDPGPPKTLHYTLGIRGSGGVEKKEELKYEFSTKDGGWGFGESWSRSELRDQNYLQNGVLILTCDLRSDGDLSVVKDNKQLKKEVEPGMEQIKTLQKTVENYKLKSENFKKQISATEREKSYIAEQYKCLLEEKLTTVSGLEKDNEQLKKGVESFMEQIKTLQKTAKNYLLESENYKKQISALESSALRKVIFFGILLFIVLEILSFLQE